MPKSLQVADFRQNLARYLEEAEGGAEFVVMSRNRAVARLSPPPQTEPLPFGLLKDQIWMAPDFDEPDEDMIDIMENGPIFPE